MKFSSARSHARSRLPLIAMLALTASMGIAGCENDGGAGPAGPGGGDTGQTGPTGPTGPADAPISQGGDVSNVGTGSTLTAQQIADIGTLVATLDSAAIAGNKPVIEITVKTDKGGAVLGLAATTLRLGVAKLVPAANGFPVALAELRQPQRCAQHPDPGPAQRGAGEHRERCGRRLAGTGSGQVPLHFGGRPEHCHAANCRGLRAEPDAPHQRCD